MAASNPTLMDIAIANGSDAVVGLVEEIVKAHPEMERGSARTIKGLLYKALVRSALPTVGFRNANEGYDPGKSTWENRVFETYIFNPRWECDKAVADAHEDGAKAFIAIEAGGIMEASSIALCSQFYYGTGADAKGFPGLLAYLDSAMTIDAGGTTANTGSSLWAVRFGPKDVQFVYGNNGSLDLSPVSEQRVLDANSKPFTAYVQELLARPGLQCVNKFSVGRIKKLTADSGKGLTDALISQLLAKFPVGKGPDVMFASRRSIQQLQASRTATTVTGAPAPIPTESFGVPILPTDSIVDTEALTL